MWYFVLPRACAITVPGSMTHLPSIGRIDRDNGEPDVQDERHLWITRCRRVLSVSCSVGYPERGSACSGRDDPTREKPRGTAGITDLPLSMSPTASYRIALMTNH